MRRPRIGIPTCLDERGRWRPGRDYSYIDRLYADSIDEAGGLPIQLPIQSAPAEAVALLDGLLLPGGDDFPSDRALPDDVTLDLVPDTQITFDRALLAAATELRLPILGICYGMQLIAQARGGVLEPHLPSPNSGALPTEPPLWLWLAMARLARPRSPSLPAPPPCGPAPPAPRSTEKTVS